MPGFRWPYRIADVARLWPELATPKNKLVGRWEQMIALLERRDQAVEDWMNTLAGGKEYATVVVAASDTHASGKAAADFVATGTDDHLTLQAAINSLPAAGGFVVGKVVLLEGTFVGSGDVTFGDAIFKIQGQGQGQSGLGITNLLGINLVSTGTSVVEAQDVVWLGNFNDIYLFILNDATVSGDIDVAAVFTNNVFHLGDLHFNGSASLTNHKGAQTAGGDAIHGTITSGGTFRLSDAILTLPVNVASSPAGSAVLDIDQLQMHATFITLDADVILNGFGNGQIDVDFLADGDTTSLKIIDSANLRVRGLARPLAASGSGGPQILLESTGASPTDNVALEYFHFVGNDDASVPPGITTCHVEIGTGVTGTKLAYNFYGGASLGDVCDSGTGTVFVGVEDSPLTEGDDAALFWMDAASGQSVRECCASSTAADETLLWMQGGTPGVAGAAGATGATGATGSAGASADESLVWMFGGTSGPAGPIGATGATGAAGAGADEAILWMESLRTGPKGDTGATGATGSVGALKGLVITKASQVINNTTITTVSYDTEVEDSSGFFAPTSDTVTIPASEDGIYAISARMAFTATVTGRSLFQFSAGGRIWRSAFTVGEDTSSVSATVRLVAGDTIVCTVFHTSGATRTLSARLELWKIGT